MTRRTAPPHRHPIQDRGDAWSGTTFVAAREGDAAREAVERFVATHYLRAHGATVTRFQPLLLALIRNDAVVAAVGVRAPADAAPLFLERYLDVPVEQALASRVRRPVLREDVAEVGNLAGAAPGSGRALPAVLAAWLEGRSIPWAVFTGTTALRNGFLRLGARLVDLGPADPARLGAERAQWGSYYGTMPRVAAVPVGDLLVAAAIDPFLHGSLLPAFSAAHASGVAAGVAA